MLDAAVSTFTSVTFAPADPEAVSQTRAGRLQICIHPSCKRFRPVEPKDGSAARFWVEEVRKSALFRSTDNRTEAAVSVPGAHRGGRCHTGPSGSPPR